MQIRHFNKLIECLGLLAIFIAPAFFSLSLTEYLLVVFGGSTIQILAKHLYRKHRFRKSKLATTR